MHEVSLMQSLLELALDHARRNEARRIHRIRMRVGALSGVVPEALEFAFEVVVRGTIAEGARFEIDRVPAVCFCPSCDAEFASPDPYCECPRCHRPSPDVRRGKELHLDSLEVS
jgi:hydrogenase nickel incorporation protein HypA/HybF